jgi:8-oxo-dGTP diphosphatase
VHADIAAVQRLPGGEILRAHGCGDITVTVTAGILRRDGLVLIARRKPGKHMAGKWEFPGGKIEQGESPEESLARELAEELDVKAKVGELLCRTAWEGDGISLDLMVYRVEGFEGTPCLREHEEIRWVAPQDLRTYDLADSDRRVVEILFR